MSQKSKQLGLTTTPGGTWVQTDRIAHERWAKLSIANPRASSVLHVLVAQMGRHNAIVASQTTLAKAARCSLPTLKRALSILREQEWIEVRQIGPTGTACAYIINDRVAWTGKRDGIRYSLFSAAVLIADDEQPDRDELGAQPALHYLPDLFPGERQLPSGPGLPPPSEPSFPGMEPDLPARSMETPETPQSERLETGGNP
jgi:hypothetical protein